MACQGKRGWLVSLQIVAPLTAIEVWRGRKLSRVLVGVAVSAALELDFEQSVCALGDVAPGARHHGVSALQGIRRRGVVFHGEGRRLESLDRVTGTALATLRAFGKLSLVRVRLVTIRALLEHQRLLEISTRVALRTFHRGMFAQQRKLCV